ncbi:hypothetical protein B0T26DRAFT_753624 [Lasiosphaeria miniovina]|uniref:Uncharacterized protein n=1 Tax=Lasiosphaeria miniovina TaxID=1954250 RepID=A0AA40ACV1_9PEZI|nr:uncharacterized protein B0T26DRAFT_753624 [Lasiosphaeria miniovina]KAK0713528.1 hypothetical protein B0T26DRAFT_753624 [Lasiosphaeria miniovina]
MLEPAEQCSRGTESGEHEIVDYMDNMDGSLHPALAHGPVLDPNTGLWVRRRSPSPVQLDFQDLYSECFNARDALVATANKYLARTSQSSVDIELSYDWASVQTALERACKVFTALIPNDLMFSSALCGGLNIIFSALEQTGFHREAVYKALERLPQILGDHDGYIEIAADDAELHRRTAKLYAEVLAGAKRLLNPSGFTTKLDDRMSEVKLATKSFKNHIARMMPQRQNELIQLQSHGLYQHALMSRQLGEISFDLKDLRRLVMSVEREDILDGVRAEVFQSLQPVLQDSMKRLIAEHATGLIQAGGISPGPATPLSPPSPAAPPTPSPKVTLNRILKTFLYDRTLVPTDISALLALGSPRIGPTQLDTDRLHALQNNARLRAWLTIDEPSALLLDGGASDAQCNTTSYFAAHVIDSLRRRHQTWSSSSTDPPITAITLAYFCSQHRDYRRDAAGSPAELALSLLLQLVDRHRGFGEAALCDVLQRVVPDDVGSVVRALGRLVRALPPSAVLFVVVDGLSFFAPPPKRRAGTREVVRWLLQNVCARQRSQSRALGEDGCEGRGGPTVKLLVAGPTRLRFVEDLFERDERVHIPADPPPLGVDRDALC